MRMEFKNHIDPDALWVWLFTNLKEKIDKYDQKSRTIQVKFYSRLFTFSVEPEKLPPPMIAFIKKSDKKMIIPEGVLAYQYYLTDQSLVFISMCENRRIAITFPIEDYYRTRVRGKQFRAWMIRMFNQLKEWENKNRSNEEGRKSKELKMIKRKPPPQLDSYF